MISTNLHSIFIIPTQYLSHIYFRNTALRMFAIKVLVSKYNMMMEKLRLGTRSSSRSREGEGSRASKSSIRSFVITEKAPTRAFSWFKAATTAFTFKKLC